MRKKQIMAKKYIYSAVFILLCSFSAVVLSGCATHFSPSNRYVLFENNEAYYMPYGVTYWHVGSETNENICGNSNTIFWFEKETFIEFSGEFTVYNIRPYADKGWAGCSRPMSDQELQYIMHQQNLRQQQEAMNQQVQQNLIRQLQQSNQQFQQQQINQQLQGINNELILRNYQQFHNSQGGWYR
jgi:hypothetical protein